ncbi:MAG: hypothetical protein ACFE7E_05335 [Candidatus Hodarchaeota archaeon]
MTGSGETEMAGRTIGALFLCLVVTWLITYFIALGNTFTDFQMMLGQQQEMINTLLEITVAHFWVYPSLLLGAYGMLVALVAGGLIGGLITRHPGRAALMAVIYLAFVFLLSTTVLVVNGTELMAAVSYLIQIIGTNLLEVILNLVILAAAVILPAVIGATLTQPAAN